MKTPSAVAEWAAQNQNARPGARLKLIELIGSKVSLQPLIYRFNANSIPNRCAMKVALNASFCPRIGHRASGAPAPREWVRKNRPCRRWRLLNITATPR
jgi:hypothetical protein